MIRKNINYPRVLVIVSLISFIFFIMTAVLLFSEKEPDVFCHAELQVYAGEGRLTSEVDSALHNGRGTVVLKGGVTHPDGKRYNYYVMKHLTYTIDDGVLLLKSTAEPVFTSRDTDISMLKGYIHNFFLSNEAEEYSLRINRLENRDNTWVMSTTGRVPNFICVPD